MWEPFAINDDLIVSSKSWIKPSILPIPDKHFSFAIARTQIRLIRTETWPTSISSNHVTFEFFFLFWSELSISAIEYANLNLYLDSCSRCQIEQGNHNLPYCQVKLQPNISHRAILSQQALNACQDLQYIWNQQEYPIPKHEQTCHPMLSQNDDYYQ